MFFGGIVPDYFRANRLLSEGRVVTAQVTGTYVRSKGGRYADYSFQVGPTTYTGRSPFKGDPSYHGPVAVTYLPDDPHYSYIDPQAKATNAKLGVLFGLVWNAIVFGVLIFFIKGVKTGRFRQFR